QPRKLYVHRKGATRAFAASHPEVPQHYRAVGQPVIIPGTMGTASYILVGTEKAMAETWGSTCHGAGRTMSRHEAIRVSRGRSIAEELARQGILARAASRSGLAEEMPAAYKDVDEVVAVVEGAGLSRKIARMLPLAVMKG
ncbi:MAG TPA: RtcB family protein, partial [bacterium]|nr:RtcB family protein [bacterium]